MTNIIELSDELEMLKSQMEILTRSMKDKNLITDDMIRQTVETRVERIMPSKMNIIISLILGGLVIPGLVMYFTLNGQQYSLGLGIFTVLMCWFGTFRTIEHIKMKTMETVRDGSLLEITETVSKLRQTNNRNKFITFILLVVWCGWWILENYSILTGSLENIIMVSIIFTFVTVGLYINFTRVEKVTRQVLKDIKNYR